MEAAVLGAMRFRPDISKAAIRLLLCCVALNLCQTVHAQKKSTTPKEVDDVVRTTTELVQTDVSVFDRRGNFVDALKAEQFTLIINGRKRPISLLSRVTAGSVRESLQFATNTPDSSIEKHDRPVATTSAVGRLIFFFVDDLHLSPESLSRARRALSRFVDVQMSSGDQVAVVSTSGQIGFLQQLTDNQIVLHEAIGRLGDRRNREGYVGPTKISESDVNQIIQGRDARLFAYLMESTKIEFALGGGARRGAHNNDSAGQAARILKNRIGSLEAQYRADAAATLAVLRNLMKSTAKLPGRKLVFFLSDGFVVDPRASNTLDALHEVTQAAAQSGVVIYSMDTRGTFMDAGVDASRSPYIDLTSRQGGRSLGETMAPRAPLSLMSEETGGRAIFNSNSIEDAIRQAVRETSDYYVLSWRPDVENERTGKARIEVAIEGRSDLRARLRRNYFKRPTSLILTKTTAPTSTDTAPETQLLAVLGSPYADRSLPTSMSVGYVKTDGASPTLQISMQMQRDAFIIDVEKSEVDVIGAAIDDRGLVYSFKQVVTVIPKTADRQAPVVWNQQLRVQPGLYQVRVATRERQTGRTGSSIQWIHVPAEDRSQLSMSSLFLGERKANETAAGPQAIRVDVDHHFHRTSVLRFQTYVYNASQSSIGADVWIEAQILRGTQQILAVAPNKVPPDVSKDPSRLPYWAEIPLDKLPAGRYTLKVVATDRESKRTAFEKINFSVE